MAFAAFSSSLNLCLFPSQRQSKTPLQRNPSIVQGPICASITTPETAPRKEDVVIVGAGIAGLATAVSLHRLGIGSLVLEQAESLRTGGTSLTLSKNGWRVLDAMGVGKDLRTQFLEIEG